MAPMRIENETESPHRSGRFGEDSPGAPASIEQRFVRRCDV